MENVSPIAAVYLLAVLVVTYVLYKRGGKKYAAMIEPLSKDDFGLKDFFPIGFTLMEMAKYQYSSAFDRKIRRQLVELYDRTIPSITCESTGVQQPAMLSSGCLCPLSLQLASAWSARCWGWQSAL